MYIFGILVGVRRILCGQIWILRGQLIEVRRGQIFVSDVLIDIVVDVIDVVDVGRAMKNVDENDRRWVDDDDDVRR